jgi:hypothetical protein
VTEPVESWKSDRRVRYLLERNIDEGEGILFAIEGMDGQCIIALDERLLVVKPGSAIDETYSGLVTSIRYSDIVSIQIRQDSSNRVIEINTSDYHVTEAHTGQGPPESNFFLSDDPNSIPIAKWTLDRRKAHLLELSALVREARETPKSMETNSAGEQPSGE